MSTISLPPPRLDSDYSIEQALLNRRSVRTFAEAPVTLADLGQLLWAAQGITSPQGFRTAPSAGALYPLEIYAVVGNVEGLASGVYKYRPHDHTVEAWRRGDHRAALADAALDQPSVMNNAVMLVFSAQTSRTAKKYGSRAERYILIEVGHAAQNVFLQAQALGLAAVVVGAFADDALHKVLALPGSERPLYLMPIGKPAR